jgi:hypothetical protein
MFAPPRLSLHGGGGLGLLAALVVVVLGAARARYAPPSPRAIDAPDVAFSGERARAMLGRVLEGDAPHPTGSEAAARVRARIKGELERMGYSPRERKDVVCNTHAACAFVTNVVAELVGSARDAVLVSAHYDSVPAAPGANDDGAGVAAALEVARALRAAPGLPRSVLFLFDDGEENGLLGALAFARADPDASRVRAVVNLDARGSRGPVLLFETTQRSAAVAEAVAAAVPRPVTSSLFSAVYRRMPNDTDFTVLTPGAIGANFAFLRRIEHYHTALDRLDNADAATIQQEGDGALAMTRAFAQGEPHASGEAVWFDVLAFGLLRWPERWTPSVAGVAALLLALAIGLRARAGLSLGEAIRGAALVPFATTLGLSLAVALGAALDAAGAAPAPWTANGPWIVVAMALAGIATAFVAASLLAGAGADGLWAGAWGAVATLGVIAALWLPSASYLFVVPALAAGAFGIGASVFAALFPQRAEGARFVAIAAPLLLLLALWSPIFLLLYDALGTPASPYLAVIAALAATGGAPVVGAMGLRGRAILPSALVLAALGVATFGASVPRFSPEMPARVNVIHVDEGATARILVDNRWADLTWGPIPIPMLLALGPAREASRFPWAPELVLQASTAPAGLAPPEARTRFVVGESAGRRSRARGFRARRADDDAPLPPQHRCARDSPRGPRRR